MFQAVYLFFLFNFFILFSVVIYKSLCGMQFTDKDVYLSYLPLAHIFDRVIEELFISKGASIGFWHKVSEETWRILVAWNTWK